MRWLYTYKNAGKYTPALWARRAAGAERGRKVSMQAACTSYVRCGLHTHSLAHRQFNWDACPSVEHFLSAVHPFAARAPSCTHLLYSKWRDYTHCVSTLFERSSGAFCNLRNARKTTPKGSHAESVGGENSPRLAFECLTRFCVNVWKCGFEMSNVHFTWLTRLKLWCF